MNNVISQSPVRRAPFWTLLSLVAVNILMVALSGCGGPQAQPPLSPEAAAKKAADDAKYEQLEKSNAKK